MSGLLKSPAPNLRPCQPLRGDHREPLCPLRPSSRSSNSQTARFGPVHQSLPSQPSCLRR